MGIKSSARAHEFQLGEFLKILFIYLFIKNLNFVAKEFQFLLRNVNMMTKIWFRPILYFFYLSKIMTFNAKLCFVSGEYLSLEN